MHSAATYVVAELKYAAKITEGQVHSASADPLLRTQTDNQTGNISMYSIHSDVSRPNKQIICVGFAAFHHGGLTKNDRC